jgi:simple sugar transport system substrate-binding protein
LQGAGYKYGPKQISQIFLLKVTERVKLRKECEKMKKSLLWVAVLVLSVSMVIAFSLAGCKATTAAETTAAATAKPFEGITIWFFTGGPEGCPFGSVVAKGAKAAEDALGPTVTYLYSDWNVEKMISQFKEAVAAAPDGICIMGHPGEVAFAPLVDQAEAAGIIVTSQNTELPGIQAKYGANGFGYVGASNYSAGVLLGKQSVIEFGLKEGDRALVYGLLAQETRGLRSKGCVDALTEAGLTVDYLEISNEINADPTLGTPVITGYISANPDVKLIITDHGAVTATVQTYLKAANVEPGAIKVAGFDLSAASVEAIKSGYLGLILDQQPFLQGYLPILQVCLTKTYYFSGLNIDTGSGFVNAKNVDVLAGLAKEGIR